MRLELALGQVAAADTPAAPGQRLIRGIVCPYGTYGNTSAGRYRVAPDAIRVPGDVRRVKLFRGHDRDRPVGYATTAEVAAGGLTMDFRAAGTPDGDAALLEAAEGVRDAFSVELDDVTLDGDTITDARLTAVALVPLPAYADARVTEVAASLPEGSTMTEPTPDPAPEPQPEPEPTPPEVEVEAAAAPAVLRAAARPTQLRPVTARPSARGVHEVAQLLASWTANPQDPAVAAALADITYTGFAGALTPEWLGELWSGSRYARQIVPLISSAPLSSYRYTGWQWTTPPRGGPYAGDKAAIPSNTPVIGPVSLQASRWAGGNDIDRAWIDFNDTEFLDSYAREMADDYAAFTDDDCLAQLLAGATAMTATNLTDAIIDAVLQVGLARLVPTFVLVSPNLLKAYAALTTQNTPPMLLALLGNLNAETLLTSTYHSMPDNTLLVGARGAAEFRELAGSPLRFDALELARGGVDRAFFGYYRTFVRKPAGIAKVTVTAP
jgi:hypothetical protein